MKGHLYYVESEKINAFMSICNKYKVNYWIEPANLIVNDCKVSCFYVNKRDYRFSSAINEAKEKQIKFYYEGLF